MTPVDALRQACLGRVDGEWALLAAAAGSSLALAELSGALSALGPEGPLPPSGVADAVEALAAAAPDLLATIVASWPRPADAPDDPWLDQAWATSLRHLRPRGGGPSSGPAASVAPDVAPAAQRVVGALVRDVAGACPATSAHRVTVPVEGGGPAVAAEAKLLAAEQRGVDASLSPLDLAALGRGPLVTYRSLREAALRPIDRDGARMVGGRLLRLLRGRADLAAVDAVGAAARLAVGYEPALAIEIGTAAGEDLRPVAAAAIVDALFRGARAPDVAPGVWAVLTGWEAP